MEQPNNTIVKTEVIERVIDGKLKRRCVSRCIPMQYGQVLTVRAIGDTTSLVLKKTTLQKGVDVRDVHAYNLESGYISPDDEEDLADKKAESKRISLSRTRKVIHELAMCNIWGYYVTITLSPELWDRREPDKVRKRLSSRASAWRRYEMNGKYPYKGYQYLFLPELHLDGAIHVHGLVTLIPDRFLAPYTMEDVRGNKPLPQYIVDKVRAGHPIYHCLEWDKKFGWNVVEPVQDSSRIANYITKYMTKTVGSLDKYLQGGKRYWASKSLRRGVELGKFIVPSMEYNANDCRKMMKDMATTDSRGRKLYIEHTLPTVNSYNITVPGAVTAKALINRADYTPQEIINQFDSRYIRLEDLENQND